MAIAQKIMTEQQYLDVLVLIRKRITDAHMPKRGAREISPEEQADLDNEIQRAMPNELLSVFARVLGNLERIAVAQEVLAGIRAKDLL